MLWQICGVSLMVSFYDRTDRMHKKNPYNKSIAKNQLIHHLLFHLSSTLMDTAVYYSTKMMHKYESIDTLQYLTWFVHHKQLLTKCGNSETISKSM